MWTSTTSLHICYFYLCYRHLFTITFTCFNWFLYFYIAWINRERASDYTIYNTNTHIRLSQKCNQECSSSMAYVNINSVTHSFDYDPAKFAVAFQTDITIIWVRAKKREQKHLISPQNSNIIYEKRKKKHVPNSSETLSKYIFVRNIDDGLDEKWWLSANIRSNMFSLIVSKTIACVNKMRVNRCENM